MQPLLFGGFDSESVRDKKINLYTLLYSIYFIILYTLLKTEKKVHSGSCL